MAKSTTPDSTEVQLLTQLDRLAGMLDRWSKLPVKVKEADAEKGDDTDDKDENCNDCGKPQEPQDSKDEGDQGDQGDESGDQSDDGDGGDQGDQGDGGDEGDSGDGEGDQPGGDLDAEHGHGTGGEFCECPHDGDDEQGDEQGEGQGESQDGEPGDGEGSEQGEGNGEGQGQPGEGTGSGQGGEGGGSPSVSDILDQLSKQVGELGQALGGMSSDSGDSGIADKAAEQIAQDVINELVREAMAGNEKAKADLARLGEQFSDSEEVGKYFGSLGVGRVFGKAPEPVRISWIFEFIQSCIWSKIKPGMRLQRRKRIWWEEVLNFAGSEREREIVVAFDASGSMPAGIVEKFATLIGDGKNLKLHWWSFDATVWPAADVEGIRGGGGTNFQIIEDEIVKQGLSPDAVLIVTDGFAPEIRPTEVDEDRFIWVITPNGGEQGDWISRLPYTEMTSIRLDSWDDLGL
jgi:hypothetical protein